jgi:hypothetical protein
VIFLNLFTISQSLLKLLSKISLPALILKCLTILSTSLLKLLTRASLATLLSKCLITLLPRTVPSPLSQVFLNVFQMIWLNALLPLLLPKLLSRVSLAAPLMKCLTTLLPWKLLLLLSQVSLLLMLPDLLLFGSFRQVLPKSIMRLVLLP